MGLSTKIPTISAGQEDVDAVWMTAKEMSLRGRYLTFGATQYRHDSRSYSVYHDGVFLGLIKITSCPDGKSSELSRGGKKWPIDSLSEAVSDCFANPEQKTFYRDE